MSIRRVTSPHVPEPPPEILVEIEAIAHIGKGKR